MTSTPKKPLVLFYTNTARAFRTTLIGHLYEISQVYRVILLSEALDSDVQKILKDTTLFPNIEKIIPVNLHNIPKRNLISQHKYHYKTAKQVMYETMPDILVTSSDWHSIFELYLMRFAKQLGVLKVTIQDTLNIDQMKKISKWVFFMNIYRKTPTFLPMILRRLLIQYRRYLGYIIYHWLLPLVAGQKPFFTLNSYVLFRGCTGLGDSDYHVVLSKRDYNLNILNGVPASKLLVLAHPITRDAKRIFEKMIRTEKLSGIKNGKSMVVVMLGAESIGIKRKSYALITEEERTDGYLKILRIVLDVLHDYRIIIKPHPLIKHIDNKRRLLSKLSDNIEFVAPTEAADKYIEIADVVMELPRAASTTLYSATLQCPNKPIIALDLQDDFLGDCYRNFLGIEYIDSVDGFVEILEKIRDNRFAKKVCACNETIFNQFLDTVDMLEYLLKSKHMTRVDS